MLMAKIFNEDIMFLKCVEVNILSSIGLNSTHHEQEQWQKEEMGITVVPSCHVSCCTVLCLHYIDYFPLWDIQV